MSPRSLAAQSDALFNLVRPGSLYERPIPERHRIIFYLGHLEAFDWNLLSNGVLGLRSLILNLIGCLLSASIPSAVDCPTDLPSDWPSLDAVRDYVATSAALSTSIWQEDEASA